MLARPTAIGSPGGHPNLCFSPCRIFASHYVASRARLRSSRPVPSRQQMKILAPAPKSRDFHASCQSVPSRFGPSHTKSLNQLADCVWSAQRSQRVWACMVGGHVALECVTNSLRHQARPCTWASIRLGSPGAHMERAHAAKCDRPKAIATACSAALQYMSCDVT